MDNEEDFIEILDGKDSEESKEAKVAEEAKVDSEEAKEIETLLSSVSFGKNSFSENILSSIKPSNLVSVNKSSFKALEEFVKEDILDEESLEDNRRISDVPGEIIEPSKEPIRGDLYSSSGSEGPSGGDFYSSGSGDTRLYETGHVDITGNVSGGGLYGGRNKIDPNERSWEDNTRWSANNNSPAFGFSGEKLIDARNMAEGEVFSGEGVKEGYSTMGPSKDYESGRNS